MTPSTPGEDHAIALRLSAVQKARVNRAASQHVAPEQFVMSAALQEANAVIAQAKRTRLSARDVTRVLELLERPPLPNARLRAAITALPEGL
jgi:uncharacterized protein (DUF1778 family)